MELIDTRPMFRPLTTEIVALFQSLSAVQWDRATVAGSWRVRDVAAHMLDTALRRLSLHRDGLPPLSPAHPITDDQDLLEFVTELNATWIAAAQRLSPPVLTELYEVAATHLCEFVEGFPADGPALFAVSWAGERESAGLFDIGREFTEIWHHGAQVRDAVGAGPYSDPRWLGAVLEIAFRALPYGYRNVSSPDGAVLRIEVSGPAGGTWILQRAGSQWILGESSDVPAQTTVRMSDDTAWRLLFNGLSPARAAAAVHVDGDPELAAPLLQTRSVIV